MWAYLCKEIVQAQRQSSNRYLSNQIVMSPKPFYNIDLSPLRSWAGNYLRPGWPKITEWNSLEKVNNIYGVVLPTVDSQDAT